MDTNHRRIASLLVAVALAAAAPAYAQREHGQGPQRDPGQAGSEKAHGEQQLDRDRDQDRAADHDRVQDRDRDQTHDQLHVQDTTQIRDQDIYGSSLMSSTEREQYRQRLQSAKTDQEWARLRMEHQEQMQTRAQSQNAALEAPVYGQYMLTTQEQARYRDQLLTAQNEKARIQAREQQQKMVRERARELGVPAPEPIYGQQLMTEQEQQQYRNRLQAAANEQERARIQNEHRTQMQERAREHRVPVDDLEPQS